MPMGFQPSGSCALKPEGLQPIGIRLSCKSYQALEGGRLPGTFILECKRFAGSAELS